MAVAEQDWGKLTVEIEQVIATTSASSETVNDGDYYFNANTNADLAAAFGVIRDQLARKMYLAECRSLTSKCCNGRA